MTPPLLGVWPPLPPGVYARRPAPASSLPFPLAEPGRQLFSRARQALMHGLCALGLGAGDALLVPAYNHGSEVEAITRAGLTCRFYGGTPDLAPEEAELDAQMTPAVRALYLIHYLGFPQDAARWRRWCDARGLYLIEDAAQAWLATAPDGRPSGSAGALALFCLYKTYGLPDGAALWVRAGAEAPEAPAAPAAHRASTGLTALTGRHAAWLMERSGAASWLVARLRTQSGTYDQAADFALGDAHAPMSAASAFLLARVLEDDTAALRRAHYRSILEDAREAVPPPFCALPDGASPFGLPIEVDHRDEALRILRDHGVAATIFWCGSHPAIPAERFPAVRDRRERTLLVPVHQELAKGDVDRIRAAVREVLHAA